MKCKDKSSVDWCLPHPIRCPETVKEIAQIYTEGDEKHQLKKHRAQFFTTQEDGQPPPSPSVKLSIKSLPKNHDARMCLKKYNYQGCLSLP